MRKSWPAFHDILLLGGCFRGFVLPVLEYSSAVCCSAVDTHIQLQDSVVSGARFLTGSVSECNIAHRRSVLVLCMLYKIMCNPILSVYGALPVPYVPVRVTRGALVAHRYTCAPPRCRTSQYHRTFIPFSASQWNDPADPAFDGVGRSFFFSTGPMYFYWPKQFAQFLFSTVFPSSSLFL